MNKHYFIYTPALHQAIAPEYIPDNVLFLSPGLKSRNLALPAQVWIPHDLPFKVGEAAAILREVMELGASFCASGDLKLREGIGWLEREEAKKKRLQERLRDEQRALDDFAASGKAPQHSCAKQSATNKWLAGLNASANSYNTEAVASPESILSQLKNSHKALLLAWELEECLIELAAASALVDAADQKLQNSLGDGMEALEDEFFSDADFDCDDFDDGFDDTDFADAEHGASTEFDNEAAQTAAAFPKAEVAAELNNVGLSRNSFGSYRLDSAKEARLQKKRKARELKTQTEASRRLREFVTNNPVNSLPKPSWRVILDAMSAFLPEDAVLLTSDKEMYADLLGVGLLQPLPEDVAEMCSGWPVSFVSGLLWVNQPVWRVLGYAALPEDKPWLAATHTLLVNARF